MPGGRKQNWKRKGKKQVHVDAICETVDGEAKHQHISACIRALQQSLLEYQIP